MGSWHPDIPAEYRNQIVTGDARERVQRTQPPLVGLNEAMQEAQRVLL